MTDERISNYNKGRAQMVFDDFGIDGLRLLAQVDRANADLRYRSGNVDLALMNIERALVAEELLNTQIEGLKEQK